MYKVGIIGPESSGKTTLAKELAQRYDGVFVPEYAREYMEQLKRPYTREDVEHIAHQQIAYLKQMLSTPCDTKDKECIYFFDTELIITKVWFEHKYGSCPEWLTDALHQYPMDVYLLCAPDIPWQEDPVRENPDIRQELFEQYEQNIQMLDIPYYIIRHTT